MAYCCIIAITRKWDHVSLSLESKQNFLIRLHPSGFVYTRLLTHLHSSTFVKWLVYSRLWLVYIRLHSSTLVCVFRIDLELSAALLQLICCPNIVVKLFVIRQQIAYITIWLFLKGSCWFMRKITTIILDNSYFKIFVKAFINLIS